MRKLAPSLAALWALGVLLGCDTSGGSSGASGGGPGSGAAAAGNLLASAPPAYISPSQAAALLRPGGGADAVGPAAPDQGKVTFDGANVPGGDPGAVSAGAGGKDKKPVTNAEPRKETLTVVEPPPPGASPTNPDFSAVKYSEVLGDGPRRKEILERGKTFLGIPYKFGGDAKSGIDCSAFVSRAWGIPRHGTGSMSEVSIPINKDELQPGDALNLTINKSETGYGHIRLFVGWADAEKKEMWIMESSGPGVSAYKKLTYSKAYQPIRRKDLPRLGGQMAPKPEDLLKPRILLVGDSYSTGAFGANLDKKLRAAFPESMVETAASCGSSPNWFLPNNKVSGHKSGCGTFLNRYDEAASPPKLVKSTKAAPTPLLSALMRPETEIVIVELGANLGDRKTGAVGGLGTIDVMAETIVHYGARCVWISVPEVTGGSYDDAVNKATVATLNQEIKARAGKYCDIVESKGSFATKDGLHPGSADATAWSEQVYTDLMGVLRAQ